MKQYVSRAQAEAVIQSDNNVLRYPHYRRNLQTHPKLPNLAEPSTLVVEANHLLDGPRKRILDIGCGMGKNALYLASQDHQVTALNPHPNRGEHDELDWAREKARSLNIPDENFKPIYGGLEDLTTSDKYDAVLCNMVLHFFDATEIPTATHAVQNSTLPGGLSIVDVYTTDNPEQEKSIRGLKNLFPSGYLGRLFQTEWQIHRDQEGLLPKPMPRDRQTYGGEYLVPSVAEIIARKAIGSYADANRQIHYLF